MEERRKMSTAGLIDLFEKLKQSHLERRDVYLQHKLKGLYFEWDDGRTIDDLISDEDDAVKNFQRNIDRLRSI